MKRRDDAHTVGQTVSVRLGVFSGTRRSEFPLAHLEQAILENDRTPAAVLKSDARSRVTAVAAGAVTVIVKEVRKGGPRRKLADALRGSPARRAFAAGRALEAAGIGVALPLAFLDQVRVGIPVRSLFVSQDLRSFPTAAERAVEAPAEALALLCDLAIRLHENGFDHGDLRAQHVHLCGALPVPSLIDLEGVRRVRALSEAQRIEALAQLNASLADEVVSTALRQQAFARYLATLPFAADDARERIIELSRSRRHLWRGDACA